MGVLIPLIFSAISSYEKRQEAANRIPRDKFIDQLEKSAVMGEKQVFDDPKTYKAAEKYGVAPVHEILNHIVNSDMTTEQRAAKIAELRSSRTGSEATQAGNENETFRQKKIMRPALEGISGAQAQKRILDMNTSGLPDNPSDLSVATTPTRQAPPAGQVAAETRGQDVGAATTRRGQDIHKEIEGGKLKLGYFETNARLDIAANDIAQRRSELEERKRTTLSATDQLQLKKDEQAIERDANNIRRAAVANDQRRTGVMEQEQNQKLVESLVDNTDLTLGQSAKASRQLRDFFSGKIDTLDPEIQAATGFSSKKLTAVKGVIDEARKMEGEATKMMDDVISAKKSNNPKSRVNLTQQEIDARLGEANAKLYKAIAYKAANRIISQEDAAAELMAGMRVYTESGEILSPSIAHGLGLKYATPIPDAVQKFMGGTKGELAPNEQGIVDRFLGGGQPSPATRAR